MSAVVCAICDLNIYSTDNYLVRCHDCRSLLHQHCVKADKRSDPTKYKCRFCLPASEPNAAAIRITISSPEANNNNNNLQLEPQQKQRTPYDEFSVRSEQLRTYCEKKISAICREVADRSDEIQLRLHKRNKIVREKIERVKKSAWNRNYFLHPTDPREIRIVGLPKGLRGVELKSAVNEIFRVCYAADTTDDDEPQDFSSQITSMRSWGHKDVESSESTVVVGLATSCVRDTLIKNAPRLKNLDAKSVLGIETAGDNIYLSMVWPKTTHDILKKARSEMKKLVDAPKPVVRNFVVCMRLPGDPFSLYPVYSKKEVKNFVNDHRAAFDKLKARTGVVAGSNPRLSSSLLCSTTKDSTTTAAAAGAKKDEASTDAGTSYNDPDDNWCEDYFYHQFGPAFEAMYLQLHLKYQKLDRESVRSVQDMRKLEITFSNRDSFTVLEDQCEIKINGLPKGMNSSEIDRALMQISKACDCSEWLSHVAHKRSWGFDSVNPEESVLVVKLDSKSVRDLIVLCSRKLRRFDGKKAFGHRADRKIRITKVLPKVSYELMRAAQSEMRQLKGPAPIVDNMTICLREPGSTYSMSIFSEMELHEFVKEYKVKHVNADN